MQRQDPLTGVRKPTHDRFREVLGNALLAEELGFDGFGVGERHEGPFLSSSPPVVLSHVAELLITTITHDPANRVRSYELLAEEWRRR